MCKLKKRYIRKPSPSFPDGVKVWYQGAEAVVDICFVHGLTGDRDGSWTADGQPSPWPQTLLPQKLPNVRILTYGYDACIVRKSTASSNRLMDHSTNLLHDLTTDRAANASSRPIIFVAHSLGGLVCKKAILLSRYSPEPHLMSIFNCVKGIIFLGTPHTGSWMADWAKIPVSSLGIFKSVNKLLLQSLGTDNQFIQAIQVEFLSMIRELDKGDRKIEITCFFEELPLPILGRPVVSKESATFIGYNLISIHATHNDMAKFSSAEENGFIRLVGELIRWEGNIRYSYINSPVKFLRTTEGSSRPSTKSSQEDIDENLFISIDHTKTALDLFRIPDSDRARDVMAQCVEAMNLRETIKKIGHFKISRHDKEIEVSEGLERIKQLERLMQYMNNTEGRIEVDCLKQSTRQLSRKIENLTKSVGELESSARRTYSGAISRCLKSMTFPEMGARKANIGQPARDTCMWIYNNSVYQSWVSQLNDILWIKGKPGSGKSTLLKNFCNRRKDDAAGSVHLSFFFNARGTPVERTPIGLYLTLLHDLLQKIPLAMCEFLPKFLGKELYEESEMVTWRLSETSDTFHSIIGKNWSRCIEVVIDALDECEEEEVRTIIRNFEDSIVSAKSSKAEIRVCWSSRYYPHISLKSGNGFELLLDKQNGLDIRRYVEAELSGNSPPSLPFIREDLISRANGIFLWAALVSRRLVKAIDQGHGERKLEVLLHSIPETLDDLFDDIFKQVQAYKEPKQELLHIAQWILCSFRPLTINELFTALSLQNSTYPLALNGIVPSKDAIDRLKKRIIDVSGGLFEVVNTPSNHSIVQVIHESVREFFLGFKGLNFLQMTSYDEFSRFSHKNLALVCFQALLSNEFDSPRYRFRNLEPISVVLRYLVEPWELPKDSFLRTYVQNYVFEHFELVRDVFADEYSPSSPFQSLKDRRQVLINFFRLRCSEIIEGQPPSPGFSSHLQRVATHAASFALSAEELSRLVAFQNNLSVCRSFFASKNILLHRGIDEAESSYESEKFIALFFMNSSSRGTLKAFSIQAALEMVGAHASETTSQFYPSSTYFVFGMTFTVRDFTNPTRRLQFKVDEEHQTRLWSYGTGIPIRPLVVSEWAIAEDIEEIVELKEFTSLVKDFERMPFHNYVKSTMLCLILRRPSPVTTGTDIVSSENMKELLMGCGDMALPTAWWWRLRGHEHDGEDVDYYNE